jgi:dTMP kinase
MYKGKPLFVTFEGIEGSGKSFQCNKLYNKIKKKKLPVIQTREPGGTKSAEKIRSVILDDYFGSDSKEKFSKYTDTLLYLAARNEHVQNIIKPALLKKKIVVCDRFIDSTFAYQVFGKGVNKAFVDSIHKFILGNTKPDLTFVLKVNILKALQRLKVRRKKNRYDKFSKNFYIKVQDAFIKIAKKNARRYCIVDNSQDSVETENIIFDKFMQLLNK